MRTVQNKVELTLEVKKDEVIDGKYIFFDVISRKLGEEEVRQALVYKGLRSKLYNSYNGGKYNSKVIYGLRCIDIDNPMKGEASLMLSFKRV